MHKTLSVLGLILWLAVIYVITAIFERLIMDHIMAYVYRVWPSLRSIFVKKSCIILP